jgi:hypothetical protein
VALVAATVTLFYCLFLFQGYQKLFRDSDAGWHIRTGEAILATGHLPRTDPYSFSRAGRPWFAWEWTADVLAGAAHLAAGLSGVALLYGVAIGASVWLWFRLHWAAGGNFFVACAMAPLMLTTCSLHWMARPHVLGWLFLIAAVTWGERCRTGLPACPSESGLRALDKPGGLSYIWVAVFMIAWANIHASFFLGFLVAALYTPRMLPVAICAPLVNPYGWHLYQHVWRYLTDSELLARIGEFQSFDYHTSGAWQVMGVAILGIAGGTLAVMERRWARAGLALVISAMALRSARGLPLAALILLPLANGAIKPGAYVTRLRALDARFSGIALVPALVLGAWAMLRVLPVGFPRDQFPVDAYPHIPAEARLFAPDKFGGYLIYRSNGTRKVFFDGRSDFYGAEFLKEYGRMVQLRPGWQGLWNRWGFTHALMPVDFPLVPALEQLGWREMYRDGTAVLLRPGT